MKMQLTPEELDFLVELLSRYERQVKSDIARIRGTPAEEVLCEEYAMGNRLLDRLRALDLVEEVSGRDYR